jgi:flagellar hook protein FlgE
MMDAIQIGLSGMRAAETAVAARARNISNVNTKGYVPVEPVYKSVDGGVDVSVREQQPAPQQDASPGMTEFLSEMPPNGAVDLVSDLVNLRMAEIAYKASAKVVQTAGRMQDAALDAIA